MGILEKGNRKMEYDKIIGMYDQPWRRYHTKSHLRSMRELYNYSLYRDRLNETIFHLACDFHDCVYEPFAKDNEEKSNEVWLKYAKDNGIDGKTVEKVSMLILSTKHPERCSTDEEIAFRNIDWNDMGVVHEIDEYYSAWLTEYEEGIFREFQKVPIEEYVKGRMEFLKSSVALKLMTKEVADYLKPLVVRKRRVGIYAGSFFPFHVGHLNILRKAENVFDKVIVAQGVNRDKTYKGNFGNLADVLKHHEIEMYSGQLVDYVNSKRSEYCEPVLVRGLRNGYDLNQETNLIRFVNEQADARGIERIPIVYISCDKEFEHISSSAIRTLDPCDATRYIPNAQ